MVSVGSVGRLKKNIDSLYFMANALSGREKQTRRRRQEKRTVQFGQARSEVLSVEQDVVLKCLQICRDK